MLTWKDISPPYLAYWMKAQKMTRDELADMLGIAKSSVNRWMSTGIIPQGRRIRIARIFNDYAAGRKDHSLTDRYGGVRTEATLYTAQEWEILTQAAKTMHMTTDEFQKWAVTKTLESITCAHPLAEGELPPIPPLSPDILPPLE